MLNLFKDYLKQGQVKKKTPDPEEAKALFKQSQDRIEYIQNKDINEKAAKFILQDSYESLRETAQSLMSIKGFKPYSHEATIAFIKEFYSDNFSEEEIYKFDYFRQLRNNSVYKAAEVSKEDAENLLAFTKHVIKKVQELLNTKV